MASVTLFAWAVPAFADGSPVDHTWVTTYDNRDSPIGDLDAVVAAGQRYWFCWGAFHPQGGTPVEPTGYLGQQTGTLAIADCLVAPNADSRQDPAARGTIFTYGVDGVCHQLANQTLYATKASGAPPLTVRHARGYFASAFIYGTYGLQEAAWANKLITCARPKTPVVLAGGVPDMAQLPDDFEGRARSVLAEKDPKLLQDLLALRADVKRFSTQAWPGKAPPTAATLNARNQHLIDAAAKLLGPEKFKEVFGFSPDEKINLVDPTVAEPAPQFDPTDIKPIPQ